MSQIICTYIEYILKHEHAKFFWFGKVYLEEDYTLFALLGGGPHQDEVKPLFDLRGLPGDSNPLSLTASFLLVSDEETDKDRWVSRRQADQWVMQGIASWVNDRCITDPDYFGHSWLTTEELTLVYKEYRRNHAIRLVCVEATIAAMRLLPEARLVYWFGN